MSAVTTAAISDSPKRAGKAHWYRARIRQGAVVETVELPESVCSLPDAIAFVTAAHPAVTFTSLPQDPNSNNATKEAPTMNTTTATKPVSRKEELQALARNLGLTGISKLSIPALERAIEQRHADQAAHPSSESTAKPARKQSTAKLTVVPDAAEARPLVSSSGEVVAVIEADGTITANPAAMTPQQRIEGGKAEAAAKKAAKAAGEPAPATPILDWMADPANATKNSTEGASRARVVLDAKVEPKVRAAVEAARAEGKSWKQISAEPVAGVTLTENQVYVLAKRGGWEGFKKA
jgi:hypothetical protein